MHYFFCCDNNPQILAKKRIFVTFFSAMLVYICQIKNQESKMSLSFDNTEIAFKSFKRQGIETCPPDVLGY